MGVTVSHSAMLTHCHTLTQACGYTEGEDTNLSHTPLHHFYTSYPINRGVEEKTKKTTNINDGKDEVKIGGMVLVNDARELSSNPFEICLWI